MKENLLTIFKSFFKFKSFAYSEMLYLLPFNLPVNLLYNLS